MTPHAERRLPSETIYRHAQTEHANGSRVGVRVRHDRDQQQFDPCLAQVRYLVALAPDVPDVRLELL